MQIRDVIHGAITLDKDEVPLIESPYFQRLRLIRQLGFAEYSYPNATHNRYVHSLGAMATADRVFNTVFRNQKLKNLNDKSLRFKALVRLGALLHDIGHGPLSHTSEFAMGELSKLHLSGISANPGEKATHEHYSLKILLDSALTPLLEQRGSAFGFSAKHVASLLDSRFRPKDDFFIEDVDGEKLDFFPLLSQIVSSEIDADRMDYLRRDSFHAGVSYGQFDFDWLSDNLTFHVQANRVYLALEHRALYSFEDFLISRFHMFLMVYFHHKSVIFDEMLHQYFHSLDASYEIPTDIEAYLNCTDAHLYSYLSLMDNPWAKRISSKNPFKMLLELHSGIPSNPIAQQEQDDLLLKTEEILSKNKIEALTVHSTSELSKYFLKPVDPIFVRYNDHFTSPKFIKLNECTDLFEKYQKNRTIRRVYVSPEDFEKAKRLKF